MSAKPEILIQPGARRKLPELVNTHPVVVLIYHQAPDSLVDELRTLLGSNLLDVIRCPDGLPTLALADELRQKFWAVHTRRDLPIIIAIGGGSTLDLAKSVRLNLPAHVSVTSILDRKIEIGEFETCSTILMPTTAGTGSEVSATATIWDIENKTKHSLFGPAIVADWAVIDPELAMTAPWSVTRDSGIDALAHALESIWNRNRVPKAFAYAMSAAQQIVKVLPQIKLDPENISLRTDMANAALWAGQAMAITETALVHALSYDDTTGLGLSHGQACGRWLPTVYQLASKSSEEMEIFLRAAMQPIISDVHELDAWVNDLGCLTMPLNDHSIETERRIACALHTKRGRNFIELSPLHELQKI
jgi:alcohol dehydrogenase class IV